MARACERMEVETYEEEGAFGPLTFTEASKDFSSDSGYNFNNEEPTLCMFCTKQFTFPQEKSVFASHLFTCHHFMIADIQVIASLKLYSDYWRSRFLIESPEKICSRMLSDARIDGTRVSCLVLGDFLQEDKLLREDLQKKRLVWVLAQQQREREDTNFSRGCLLCRLKFRGLRANYLNHLSLLHNMQLGKPENLVFIDEMLNIIKRKMDSLQCLYCNKFFPNWNILKEHMRKKQHKKINADDSEFDKFYIINYLEMGKDWHQIQDEPDEDPIEVANSDGYVSDGDWSDWQEDDDAIHNCVVCLFCAVSANFDDTLIHMRNCHNFNFTEICLGENLDFYQQVKLVNYVRRKIHAVHCPYCDLCFTSSSNLLEHMAKNNHFVIPAKHLWNQPEYFFPTYENDSFLCHLDDSQDNLTDLHLSQQLKQNCHVGSTEERR